ncbi:MAG: MFS transporter, partial [Devosia nanyangense]|nr:MFS transporter [Devosia nanyangense]
GLVALAFFIEQLGARERELGLMIGAAVVGVFAMVLFVRRQRNSAAPLIDFKLFHDNRFTAGVIAALVASTVLVGVELVVSQRLQLVLGHSPLQAAFAILPIPLAAFVSGPLAGMLVPRLGAGRVLWGSLALAGIGLAGYLVVHNGPLTLVVLTLAAFGFGLGATMTAASTAIMDNAPIESAGSAASVEEVSYELGGAIGIAVLGSILTAVYGATLMPPANLDVPATVRDSLDEALLASEKLAPDAAATLQTLAHGAFDQAFVVVLGVAAALIFVAALAIWRAVTDRRPAYQPSASR